MRRPGSGTTGWWEMRGVPLWTPTGRPVSSLLSVLPAECIYQYQIDVMCMYCHSDGILRFVCFCGILECFSSVIFT